MLYPSVNEIRSKADSRYTVVVMAAKRARDLIDGKPVLAERCVIDKPVSIASSEIAEEMITYKREEEHKADEEVELNEVELNDFEITEEPCDCESEEQGEEIVEL